MDKRVLFVGTVCLSIGITVFLYGNLLRVNVLSRDSDFYSARMSESIRTRFVGASSIMFIGVVFSALGFVLGIYGAAKRL